MEERSKTSSKTCILRYSQVEDRKLPRTHKNKIHTPDRDLGLLPLTPPRLISCLPQAYSQCMACPGLLRVLRKHQYHNLQLS